MRDAHTFAWRDPDVGLIWTACVHCGSLHVHGAGCDTVGVQQTRTAHCLIESPKPEYSFILLDGVPPAAIVHAGRDARIHYRRCHSTESAARRRTELAERMQKLVAELGAELEKEMVACVN